jgi:pyrroline-5-carboxylate reductase
MSEKNAKFAFIGAGNMAFAIVGGMKGHVARENICLYDKLPSQYEKFGKGYVIAPSAEATFDFADYVFFAVKPQNFDELLEGLRNAGVSTAGKTVVTIAAGIPTSRICRGLGEETAVVRVMPNTPALLGKGVTALCRNGKVTDAAFETVKGLFSNIGMTFVLPESQMNDVIALNSSSPAYVFLFVKAMVDASLEMGFSREGLMEILCGVLTGSAEMLLKSGKTPEELIAMVKSPKGTTEKALDKLAEYDFEKAVREAMFACSKRAEELGKG